MENVGVGQSQLVLVLKIVALVDVFKKMKQVKSVSLMKTALLQA
jgi:hypothetical protein